MRTMFDAAIAANIPTDADIVAGYDDGKLYKWSAADWARFPNSTLVHISATGETLTSHVIDLEPGDADPDDAADWLRRRLAAGITTADNVPTIYCGLYNLAAARAACSGLDYQLWIASPTGQPHMVDGAMVTQWAWGNNPASDYDTSMVSDDWSPIKSTAAPAVPTPAPAPESTVDSLVTALAYVCDTLSDQLEAVRAEMQRVRTQFLGARPS